MTRCVECSQFSMRDSPEMARHGYGNCARRKIWEYSHALAERECVWFTAAKKEDVEKRLVWLEKKNQKTKGAGNGNGESGSTSGD